MPNPISGSDLVSIWPSFLHFLLLLSFLTVVYLVVVYHPLVVAVVPSDLSVVTGIASSVDCPKLRSLAGPLFPVVNTNCVRIPGHMVNPITNACTHHIFRLAMYSYNYSHFCAGCRPPLPSPPSPPLHNFFLRFTNFVSRQGCVAPRKIFVKCFFTTLHKCNSDYFQANTAYEFNLCTKSNVNKIYPPVSNIELYHLKQTYSLDILKVSITERLQSYPNSTKE